MKLNLGCGIRKDPDYTNIDLDPDSGAEIIANVSNLGFLGSNTVEEIMAYHLIEHLTDREFLDALTEWTRVLKHGGRIVLECPDFTELCREWLQADRVGRWHSYKGTWHSLIRHFYGNQRTPLQVHKAGFDKEKLTEVLTMQGFTGINFLEPEYLYCPSLRVEAFKR